VQRTNSSISSASSSSSSSSSMESSSLSSSAEILPLPLPLTASISISSSAISCAIFFLRAASLAFLDLALSLGPPLDSSSLSSSLSSSGRATPPARSLAMMLSTSSPSMSSSSSSSSSSSRSIGTRMILRVARGTLWFSSIWGSALGSIAAMVMRNWGKSVRFYKDRVVEPTAAEGSTAAGMGRPPTGMRRP
jgi:hypothetical protein